MSHAHVEIENGLYGFKSELKERLGNGDVPGWFGVPSDEVLENIEFASKLSKKRGEPAKSWFEIMLPKSGSSSGLGRSRGRLKTAPEKIVERCREFDSSQYTKPLNEGYSPLGGENQSVGLRGYDIEVTVGPRGGIRDVELTAHFYIN